LEPEAVPGQEFAVIDLPLNLELLSRQAFPLVQLEAPKFLRLALFLALHTDAASQQTEPAAAEPRQHAGLQGDQALAACDWPLRLAFSVCF
jgi:hypothetical protein